jgi:hypothetical protein
MKIYVTLSVDDDEMADPEHETGLTEKGFEAFMEAMSSAGFSVDAGPTAVKE